MTAADRIATALEGLVSRLDDPNEVAAMRIGELEGRLRQVVALVQQPYSTDDEWLELVDAIQETLGVSTRVEVT